MPPDRHPPRDAIEEMQRVLDVGPTLHRETRSGDARFTRRWAHGAIHDRTAPMLSHVAMTYFGAAQRIEWRDGRDFQRSLTRRGTVTLIPSLHEAHWDVHGPIEVSHVYIAPARLDDCARAMDLGQHVELDPRVGFEDPVASRLIEILAMETESASPAGRLMQDRTVDLLCMQLVRAHSSAATTAEPAKQQGLSARQVKTITDYLTAHLHEDVGLDDLAELVGLSRFHICKAFRQTTGMPPHRWLILRRMTEAKALLTRPERSVAEIAMALGYQSPSAFIAAFRKVTGLTPLQFRRQL